MAVEIGTLRALLTLNSASFEKGIKRSERRTKQFRVNLKRVAVAVAAVGAAMIALTKRATGAAESIADVSAQANTSAENLQGLRRAFDQNGGSAQRMDEALIRATKRISEAAQGSGIAADALARLGVSIRDVNGNIRGTDEITLDVADAISEMSDKAQAGADVADIYGSRLGPRLLPLLRQGRGAIEEYTEAMRKNGELMGNEAVQSAAAFSAEARRLTDEVNNRLNAALIDFAPVLQTIISGFKDVAAEVLKSTAEIARFFGIVETPVNLKLRKAIGELREVQDELSDIASGDIPFSPATQGLAARREALQQRESNLIALVSDLSDERNALEKARRNARNQPALGSAPTLPPAAGGGGATPGRGGIGGGPTPPGIDTFALRDAFGQIILPDLTRDARNLGREAERLSGVFSGTLSNAFRDGRFSVERFGQSLVDSLMRMTDNLITQALRPLEDAISNMIRNLLDAANSGGGSGGSIIGGIADAITEAIGGSSDAPAKQFAKGGVVNRPTVFPMAKGIGLMGEAGPEAILPLKRGPGGDLGVAGGGGGVDVVINNFSGQPAQQTRRQGPGGREVLEVEIGRQIGQGRQDKALGARFGATPQPVRRG